MILKNDLNKVGANLSRLEGFFCSRLKWTVKGPEKEALREVRHEISSLAGNLGTLLRANTIGFPPRKNPAMAPQVEPGDTMSAELLLKYVSYLKQVNRWFNARNADQIPEDATASAQSLRCSLCTVEEATQMILGEQTEKTPDRNRAKPASIAAEPKLRTVVRDPANLDPNKSRLVLENSPEKPLIEINQKFTNLSPHAEKIIATYLADNKIELNSYQLRKFLDKVKRWITATPESQVLVLKIGPFQLEPFSSFVAKKK